MADGTVRGTFDLNADPALRKLRSIRTEGGRADDQMVALGTTMDRVGGANATRRLDTYANRLGKVADTAERTTARVSTSWDAQRRSISDQSTRIEARVDTLQNRIERYGRTRASATVEVNGFDKANAQIMELERRLDKLSRQRSTPTVGLGGGFFGGGATTAAGGSSAGGGGLGVGGKLALGGAALLPGAQALGVSATALAGSASGAALGVGVGYGGAISTLGTGAALTAGVAKPAIKELQELQKEQAKYTEIVRQYGAASKQAAVGRRELTMAESRAGPGAAVAARQVALTRSAYLRGTAPGRASVYGAVGNVAVAGRMLAPTVSRAANLDTAASAAGATRFAGFLTGSQTQRTITGLSQEFAHDLPVVEHTLENITSTVEHLSLAARPFFREGTEWVQSWTHGLSANSSNEARVQSTMRGLVTETKDWGKLAGATFRTVRDIFNMGRPSGDSMVVNLTETLDRWDSWIQRNPQKVRGFFNEAQTTTEKIGSALTGIAHTLSQLATTLGPLFNQGMGLISLASRTGILGSPLGIGGSIALYKAGASKLGGMGGAHGSTAAAQSTAGGTGAVFLAGASSRAPGGRLNALEGVSNVRTVSTVTRGPGGTFIAGPASRARPSEIYSAANEYTGGAPFVGVASRSRIPNVGRGLSNLARKAGGTAADLSRTAAPFLALNDVTQLAAGNNPLHSSSALGGVAGATAQGAIFGAAAGAIGGPLAPVTAPVGAAIGAGVGLIGGVASNAAGLHRDIFGPSSPERDAAALKTLSGQISAVGGDLSRLSPEQMKKVNAEATALGRKKSLSGFALELTQIQKATGTTAQAVIGASRRMGGSWSAMRLAAKKSFGEIGNVATTTAEGIKQELGDKSREAKEALSMNFAGAAKAADLRMKETGQYTTAGLAFVNKELGSALNVFGIKAPKNATAAQLQAVLTSAQGGDTAAGFNKAGGAQDLTAAARAKQGRHARGGFIGGSGLLDTQDVPGGRAAAGEAWIANRHTMADLSRATMAHYGKTAEQMITSEHRSHSSRGRFATGGFHAAPGTNYSVGNEPQIAADLNRLGQALHINLTGISGYRSPSHSVAVGGFPNDPHTRGEASDTPGVEGVPESTLERYGLTRPFPGAAEADHIQLFGGGRGVNGIGSAIRGAASAAEATVRRAVHLKARTGGGKGIPGLVADGALTSYAKALQTRVNSRLGASGGASFAGVRGHGGAPGANERLGRQMMLAAGWPGSEWPALKALWTQESGWNANSVNSSSGAYGIPQALGHGHPFALGDARGQIAWGLNYIRGRYGSPSAAEAHERSSNWYARGGRAAGWGGWNAAGGEFATNGPTVFGAGEKGRERVSITPLGQGAGKGGHNVTIAKGAIHVSLGDGSSADVKRVAKEVAAEILDELDAIGDGPSDRELIGR